MAPNASTLSSDLIPTTHDVHVIRTVVKEFTALPFVQQRIQRNLTNSTVSFSKDVFWKAMLDCLLSSCRRVGRQQFGEQKAFSLNLHQVRTSGQEIILERLMERGVSRFPVRVARMAGQNFSSLEAGGWKEVEHWHTVLAAQRRRNPQTSDFVAERDAARFVDLNFAGFGPKQSRNLWQMLGLTRFEIPIDRRVCRWINLHLSVGVTPEELLLSDSYERLLDFLQRACLMADNVPPCVLDAVVFSLGAPELKRKRYRH
jgi:hypothetical protein